MRLIHTLIYALWLFVAGSALAHTTQCQSITAFPVVINTPGKYCVEKSTVYNTVLGAAITIESDNVTIDFNQHTLLGWSSSSNDLVAAIVANNHKNITLRSGWISGFPRGIAITGNSSDSRGHIIENMKVSNFYSTAITLNGDSSLLRNNKIYSSSYNARAGNKTGMQLSGSDIRVLGNYIFGVYTNATGDAHGIRLISAPRALVKNNALSDLLTTDSSTLVYGILINQSSGVVLSNNRLLGIAGGGIFFDSNSSGKYSRNITQGVTTPFTGGTAVGINN